MCAHRLEALPLHIRSWKCPPCATVHDRDYNAAKNILAAGRAERRNASHNGGRDRAGGSGGAPVSPLTTQRINEQVVGAFVGDGIDAGT